MASQEAIRFAKVTLSMFQREGTFDVGFSTLEELLVAKAGFEWFRPCAVRA